MTSNNESESRTFSFTVEPSHNKTVIDFNFGTHKDSSALKGDINIGPAASALEYHFFRTDTSSC